MSYIQQVSELLTPLLLPSAIQDFVATDGVVLEDYDGEFLLRIRENSCYLSVMGNDIPFENEDGIQEYFCREQLALFDEATSEYIYGIGYTVRLVDRNSAIIMLAQARDEYLYLNKYNIKTKIPEKLNLRG